MATETPMAMIAPMNDWTLSVVRVSHRASATPAITAGIAASTTSAMRKRLEVGREQEQDHHDGEQQPHLQSRQRLVHRRNLATHIDRHAARGLAGAANGLRDLAGRAAQVLP